MELLIPSSNVIYSLKCSATFSTSLNPGVSFKSYPSTVNMNKRPSS